MISIDAVESGLACDCVCPACARPLVAAKGDIYRHHFRHHADDVLCGGARETALHRYAKQVICETLELGYPRWHHGYQKEKFEVELGALHAAASEVDLFDTGIRADVFAEFEHDQVAVEIYVAHRVPEEKVRKLAYYNIAAIEIDLSLHRYADKDEAGWREAVLHHAPRYWLVPPKAVREAEQEKRRQWLERQREREEMLRAIQRHHEEERLAQQARLKDITDAKLRDEQERLIVEAKARERKATQAALDEHERVKRAERRLQFAAQTAALEQQRRRALAPPSLQTLIAAHGTYTDITPEAWAAFDFAMQQWRLGVAIAADSSLDPASNFTFLSDCSETCEVCGRWGSFGYRREGRMRWFCDEHRLAKWWSDARA